MKLPQKKIGATIYGVCARHGLRPEDFCSLCDRTCPGCGESKDTIAMEGALVGAGYSTGHEKCDEKTDGFFMERKTCDHECTSNCRREGCNCKCGEFHEVEPPDAMLSKDEKFA